MKTKEVTAPGDKPAYLQQPDVIALPTSLDRVSPPRFSRSEEGEGRVAPGCPASSFTIKKGDLYTILFPDKPSTIRICGIATTDVREGGYFDGLETIIYLSSGRLASFAPAVRSVNASPSGQVVCPLIAAPAPPIASPAPVAEGVIDSLLGIVESHAAEIGGPQ